MCHLVLRMMTTFPPCFACFESCGVCVCEEFNYMTIYIISVRDLKKGVRGGLRLAGIHACSSGCAAAAAALITTT